MRIITGKARGTRLTTLPGEATRPTSEKVKEAIFSAIQFDIGDRKVLDLFGGSGQMALEALSRGAENAVIVDSSRAATEVIRNNAAKTKLLSDCRVVTADWKDYLRMADGKNKFSLVFLDPPYKEGFVDEILKRMFTTDILEQDCIIIAETAPDGVPVPPDGWECKAYRYGSVAVTVMRRA